MMKDKQKKRRNGKNSIRSIQITSLIERSDKINSFKESIIIVIWYGIFGFLWILMTDAILNWLISDPIQYRNAQLVKGWLYVFLTIVFIFLVVKRRIDLIKNFIDDVVATNIVLDKTEEELYIQNAFTDEIIGSAPVIIAIWDEEGSLKSVNPYALEVLGYDATSVFYQEWMELLFSEENKASLLSVYEIVRKDEHLKNHGTELITKDGRIVNILWNGGTLNLNRAGKYEYVSFGVDVTELKKAEDQWKHLAYNDYLTDLPNRVSLEQEVTKRFFTASDPFVLLYLDVDNFKYINDSLGHNVGDELLKHISKCLKKKNYDSSLCCTTWGR
jgi:PAS domain S-box-containing protein